MHWLMFLLLIGVYSCIELREFYPRAEGEIAFRLKKDLIGPGVCEQDVLDATATIIPCFEIVDSRIDDWNIKIEDTVAVSLSRVLFQGE
ncbi:MAG: 2-keto-4-pentenoate hydratase [Halioglobus sp.]|jgi:2-keto-4-pentenoate hydratase